MASSAPAFLVINDLVSTLDKVAKNDNVVNSSVSSVERGLLDHLHRWKRYESSARYYPALVHFLGRLIRTVFGQLIAELRNLSTNAVFASDVHIGRIAVCWLSGKDH